MPNRQPTTTIIIGSGLAGLTTALEILNKSSTSKVTIVEKTDKLGGNSIKASSGMNGVPTRFHPQDSLDSVDVFYADTVKSGKGLSDEKLVKLLVENSGDAIHWLADEHAVILNTLSQLGGHSHPRTHRGGGKLPPGFEIISALTKKLDEFKLSKPDRLSILTHTRVSKLLVDSKHANKVNGVQYLSSAGELQTLLGDNVVLATGGFSADVDQEDSLIKRFRPDLVEFPSSNGEQTTGDGAKLAERDVGAQLIHMDKVQVHPTGFIKITNPNSNWKFLCGEVIRGIGGILLSPNTGMRFVNELTTRDGVTDAIINNCKVKGDNNMNLKHETPIAAIVVNLVDYHKAKTHIDFYGYQKLLHKGNIEDLLLFMKTLNPGLEITRDSIAEHFQQYNSYIRSGKDLQFGRSSFGGEFNIEHGLFYFGLVTPVLHFSMGGIKIDEHARVITKADTPMSNLYAVGEVSGGVHGANRLGGSSLLECVVFGKLVSKSIIPENST
ncbi:Fumarate reductase 1 [Spathaspora sp. JA1]|nr:Fumarate reductase 1 [Spathaspora sp. JA1]